jgi:hypothetical protein
MEGLIAGLSIGFFSKKVHSLSLGIVFGLAVSNTVGVPKVFLKGVETYEFWLKVGDLAHDLREVEIFEAPDLGADATGRDGQLAASLKQVNAEAVVVVVVVGEVELAVMPEVLVLAIIKHIARHLEHQVGCADVGLQALERAAHAELLRQCPGIDALDAGDPVFLKVFGERKIRALTRETA